MPASREHWQAFIDWCQREIDERKTNLAPMERGAVRTGRRGPDTGGEWIDTTAANIQSIKNEIASLQTTIDRNRHNVE